MVDDITVDANEDLMLASEPPASDFAVSSGESASSEGILRQDLVMRIPVTVQVIIGKTKMAVSELMNLGPGTIVSLDRSVGDPVDLVVNGHLVARGQLVVVDEETSRFGISLTEVVEHPPIS